MPLKNTQDDWTPRGTPGGEVFMAPWVRMVQAAEAYKLTGVVPAWCKP